MGAFRFTGNQLFIDAAVGKFDNNRNFTFFHYIWPSNEIHSQQASAAAEPTWAEGEPFFRDSETSVTLSNGGEVNFFHPFTRDLLGTLTAGGLTDLFDYYINSVPDDNATIPHKIDAFGGDSTGAVYHELKRAYSGASRDKASNDT